MNITEHIDKQKLVNWIDGEDNRYDGNFKADIDGYLLET